MMRIETTIPEDFFPPRWAYFSKVGHPTKGTQKFRLVRTLPAQPELALLHPGSQAITARRSAVMAYAYPVNANVKLYIRDPGTLWAYDIKAIP
jgi:hypothetical protein